MVFTHRDNSAGGTTTLASFLTPGTGNHPNDEKKGPIPNGGMALRSDAMVFICLD